VDLYIIYKIHRQETNNKKVIIVRSIMQFFFLIATIIRRGNTIRIVSYNLAPKFYNIRQGILSITARAYLKGKVAFKEALAHSLPILKKKSILVFNFFNFFMFSQ